jgi:hypothetical protein
MGGKGVSKSMDPGPLPDPAFSLAMVVDLCAERGSIGGAAEVEGFLTHPAGGTSPGVSLFLVVRLGRSDRHAESKRSERTWQTRLSPVDRGSARYYCSISLAGACKMSVTSLKEPVS